MGCLTRWLRPWACWVAQGPRGLLFKELLPKVKPVLDTSREIAQARRKSMSEVAINCELSRVPVCLPACLS
jgi:pyridoxine 4-dehydrogenase